MTTLLCINIEPLKGNDVSPPLKLGDYYPLVRVILDKEKNEHYDVGLISKVSYVTSFETGETLPESGIGKTHWCHPSRFEIVEQ